MFLGKSGAYRLRMGIFVVALACVGMYLLIDARANTTTLSLQPENGAAAGSVSKIQDTSASGGSAVRFAQASTDPAFVAGWGMPAWRDEFDSNTVNSTKWNVRSRSDLGLLFDAAVPDPGQVSVVNGVLTIRGDWLDTPFQRPAGQSGIPLITHKTGYLDHRSLKSGDVSYAQRWGRWEMRAKTPTGPKTLGSLAAFWLRNSNSGEIDIMEAWGYNAGPAPGGQRIDTSTTTVHTQTSGSGNQKYIWHHADHQTMKHVAWDGFHTYAFELMPTYAKIIVNGKTLVTTTPAQSPNLWDTQYFNTPLHVRLNLHIGPSVQYWGIPDPNNRSITQPLKYEVDYVRIYQAPS